MSRTLDMKKRLPGIILITGGDCAGCYGHPGGHTELYQ